MKPPPKPKEPKKWHGQQELILKSWGESSSCYRYLHFQSYQKFKASNMKFTLPIIVISTITGTANFAQETFPVSIQSYVPLGIGAFNLIAAIMTTVLQFLKVTELMEAHRVASISYGKLARDIKLELSLPRSERHNNGDELITRCSGEYDRLIEQSPPVPADILNKFENIFGQETSFDKPEITTIQSINLFDSIKETQAAQSVASVFKKGVNIFNMKKPLVKEAETAIAEGGTSAPAHTITIESKQHYSESSESESEEIGGPKKTVLDELRNLQAKNLVTVGAGNEDVFKDAGDCL